MNLAQPMQAARLARFDVWASVWKLLRLRVLIWWNTLRRAKLRRKIWTAVIALFVLAIMVGLFIGSSFLLRFLRSPTLAEYLDPTGFLESIPTLILTAAFFITIFTNFGVLLQALYLSRDMDFLVVAPLPMRSVFLAKLLEAVLPNFLLFCAFSLPVLFGLGTSSGYSLFYYLFLIVVLVLLSLAAGGLASILVMAVVRVVPARRVAEVIGVIGAMLSFLCGQSGNLIDSMDVDRADVGGALMMLERLNLPWSPLAWAGRGLVALGQGNWLPGFGLTLLSLLVAGAIFAGTLYLAEQLYYSGWASMQVSTGKKRARPARGGAPAQRLEANGQAAPALLARLVPQPVRGLMRKDLALLRRDPRNVSNLITPLILGVVMLFTTRGGGRNASRALGELGLSNLEVFGVLALALMVSWMLMFNLATLAFSREGRNYWLLKAAPLRPAHLLSGKFVVSFLPAAALGLLYLLVAFAIRGIAWDQLPYAALVILFSLAGGTSISLAYGVVGANLEWDSPQRQRLQGSAGCLSVIFVPLYMLIDVLLFLAPPVLWQILTGEIPALAYLAGGLLGAAGAGVAVVVPLLLVAPRLGQIGEPN